MTMLNNLSIKARLIFVIGVLALASLLVGGFGLYSLSATNAALRMVYNDRLLTLAQLGEVLTKMQENQSALAIAAGGPPERIAPALDQVKQRIGEISKILDAYLATAMDAQEKALAQQFADSRRQFVAQGLTPVLTALRANDQAAAMLVVQGPLVTTFAQARDHMRALVKLQAASAKGEYDAALTRYERARTVALVLVTLSLVCGAVIGAWLIRSIGAALGQALRVANSVAAGDLTERIDIVSRDEVGQLLMALQKMNSGLVGIVGEVRSGTDLIATASSQIASGNQDLSSRTEAQASSLEQTAASMEELTSTVRQNADNARQANMLAATASSVASKGGDVIGQVVHTMAEINTSSRKIVDIISVIDGIAFQTNILALNAAVEAARAGEQGRGFAVVASEVRNLAQRSAAAAREIKALIGDSVERVDAGSLLVNEAGKTMLEIVDSVRRVTDIMGEISSASQEQTTGIDQINRAITQMDEVTQQNAALVEQASAAAATMLDQAASLAQVVGAFKLTASLHAAPRLAPAH